MAIPVPFFDSTGVHFPGEDYEPDLDIVREEQHSRDQECDLLEIAAKAACIALAQDFICNVERRRADQPVSALFDAVRLLVDYANWREVNPVSAWGELPDNFTGQRHD